MMAEAAFLLESWPDRILDSTHASGLWGTFILEQRIRSLPFWLVAAIQDPICRLRFPEAAIPSCMNHQMPSRACPWLLTPPPNAIERINFVRDHPEWWNDLPQLVRAMKDLGVYHPSVPDASIERSCRTHVKLLARHASLQRVSSRPVALSGFRARLIAQYQLVQAIKVAVARRLGLI